MANTGVKLEPSVITLYEAFKKVDNPGRYMKLKIDEETKKTVILDGEPSTDSNYENLRASLNDQEPRFIVYKMKFTTTDGRENEKLVLISW